jgi:hypothetical protein
VGSGGVPLSTEEEEGTPKRGARRFVKSVGREADFSTALLTMRL